MIAKIRYLVPVLAIAILVAVVASACGRDDGDIGSRVEASEEQLHDLQDQLEHLSESVEKTQVATAMNTVRSVPLHDMDVALQTASEIPEDVSESQIRRARQAVQAVTWPEELREDAEAVLQAFQEFEDAVARGDLAASKAAATKAHDTWHDFEGPATEFMTGEEAGGH
jgi:hypothetical protein